MSQNATFTMILREAYPGFSLPGQIVGPDWITSERFDINARADGEAPHDVITAMLRQLLADRFVLRVHMERRELDVYALVDAREDGRPGRGLRKPAVDCDAIETETHFIDDVSRVIRVGALRLPFCSTESSMT